MLYKDLVILNNEKVYKNKGYFYCENLDLKVLPEGLNDYYRVNYIVRKSKKKQDQKIDLQNIKVASSIFSFIFSLFKTFKNKDCKYLLISITPYTFFSFLFLLIFKKKVFTYLFSSGHEEYKHILGRWSVWIYDIMYKVVTSNSKVIVCHERLYDKEKSHLVYISRLDNEWVTNHKTASLDKTKFLYVGRVSKEKGIFDFLKMFSKININSTFSIVGNLENQKIIQNNVKTLGYIADTQLLIDVYDEHNIMILPSFTEATPYVVDEALARKRPVIIFEDIEYIVRGKKGIFVSKRDTSSFVNTAKFIMDNYLEIQKNMEKNVLPTKKSMIKQISDIIKLENY